MSDLIRFELKKILTRKTTLVTCIAVLVMMCGIMGLNIIQARSSDAVTEQVYTGLESIAYDREKTNAHAGTLTSERVADDIEFYQAFIMERMAPEELADLSNEAAYQLMNARCANEDFAVMKDPYYSYLTAPWSEGGEEPYQTAMLMYTRGDDPAEFYERLYEKSQIRFEAGLQEVAKFHYSSAEYDMWMNKLSHVSTPFEYGYAGAWDDILNCVAFLVFPMIAICVALAPVFSSEYSERTDAVLLSARWGRSKLVKAKLIASFLMTTSYFVLCAAIVVLIPLAAYGPEGANLPTQILSAFIPYNLTMGQATAIALGLGYAITLGVAGLTLALSSRLRSQLAILAVIVALIFFTGMIGSSSETLQRILYLFPLLALNKYSLLISCTSYGFGPVAFDLMSMVCILWLALAAICTPFAAASFKRHQVA